LTPPATALSLVRDLVDVYEKARHRQRHGRATSERACAPIQVAYLSLPTAGNFNYLYTSFSFRFPFYYELKIVFLIWLVSPVSRGSLGSSTLYRKLVHPNLMKREEEIDRLIARVQEQSYNTALKFGSRAFQAVTNAVMQTAIRVSVC